MEEDEKKFGEAQQALLENFKEKLKQLSNTVIDDLYTNVSNHATTDAHINFYNRLRDEAREEFVKEISSHNGRYSWAASMRALLLKNHREELQTKIISDLEEKVKSLNEHIEDMRKYR